MSAAGAKIPSDHWSKLTCVDLENWPDETSEFIDVMINSKTLYLYDQKRQDLDLFWEKLCEKIETEEILEVS